MLERNVEKKIKKNAAFKGCILTYKNLVDLCAD